MPQRKVTISNPTRIGQRTKTPHTRETQRTKEQEQEKKDAGQLADWGSQARQPRAVRKAKGKNTSICGGKLYANKIAERKALLQAIKGNEHLIHRYQDLINPDHHTASFAVYKAELDEEQAELTRRYDFLQRMYNKASNGEIPSLQEQNEELRLKLKNFQSVGAVEQKKKKAKNLRLKIKKVMAEMAEMTDVDIEELIDQL